MKKLVLSLMAAVALMFVPQALTAVNFVQYLATYGNSLTVGTDTLGGVTYSTVRYGDLYNGGEPGLPSLPIDYIRFSVPYNATNFTVTASPSRWSTSNLSYLLYPCQMPWIPNDSIAPPIMLPDTAAYYSGVSYPSQMAWVADEGFLAGENHIVTVAVMPFRYTHSSTSDEVRKCRNLTVRLNYELSDSLAMYPIVRNDSALREEGYQLAQSMVVNSNQVKSFSFSYSNPGVDLTDPIIINGGTGGNMVNGGGGIVIDPPFIDIDTTHTNVGGEQYTNQYYPYLIVTTSDLRHATRRIAALKRQKGYNVKVVTMDEVMNDSIACLGNPSDYTVINNDSAVVLRQFLRNYYQKYGTDYVLFAGDVPYCQFNYYGVDILSDYYFRDLSTKWWQTSCDHFPELSLGRITSNTEYEIDCYTNKLFRYDLNPGNGDYSYLRKAFFSEGRDYKNYLNDFKSSLNSIYTTQVVINDENNNSMYPYGKDIIDTIRTYPVGLICIFNHGDTTRTRIYGYNSETNVNYFIWAKSDVNYGRGLNCLFNKSYPMIYYSPSCTTMPFDNTKLTFGESFIRGKDYGGPVYIGHTRWVYEHEASSIAKAFANEIKAGCVILGDAVSKSNYKTSTMYAFLTQGFLGDPALEIWTDEPQVYSNISIDRGAHAITITGIDADSTIVAYCSNDKKPGYRMTSSSTLLLNNVSPNSTIMLYKHNHIPYIAPLELQNIVLTNSQYVIASDVTCGQFVNSNRVKGAVVVKEGVEYEIEATGTVSLQDGFIVEKGATFAVYPSCF